MLIGILFGLGAALSQTLFYLFSRAYPGGALRLLIISHLYMGLFALICLPFVIPETIPPLRNFAASLAGAGGFYVVGQTALMFVLKKTEASRVASLLGLKIVIISVMGILFFGHSLSTMEWVGVVCTTLGGWVINSSGKAPHRSTLPLVLLACLSYGLSDLNIHQLVRAFPQANPFKASLFSAVLIYLSIGILFTPYLFFARKVEKIMWIKAAPHAFTWFVAMVCLFCAYAYIGVIFGVVVQSSRGMLSIFIGYFIGRYYKGDLEEHISPSLFFKRITGGALMTAGVVFFAIYGT